VSTALAAVDLGATSGRVVVGRIADDLLETEEVHRFPNNPIRLSDGLHWDVLELYRQILVGLRKAEQWGGGLLSIGIDSWGVDYALIDAAGSLIGNPFHYRDERTALGVEAVHQRVSPAELYARTGLQFLPFNTVYQLAADDRAGTLVHARTMLLTPDLFTFWLSGRRGTELTNASTTGLLDVHSNAWDEELIAKLGFRQELFAELHQPGHVAGELQGDVASEAGLQPGTAVTLVASHDTASAVVGVPATEAQFAYISCGTWALVGLELESPVVLESARQSGFTNERGVDGTTRFLHNVMGLWLVEESLRYWESVGIGVDRNVVLAAAAALSPGGPTVDPNDARFFPPGDIPRRIQDACRDSSQVVPQSKAEIVRCIVDSLALAFAQTLREAERLSGHEVKVIHLVGGGARNELLCQLTAIATGVPVVAGPTEAAAIGNLLVQARAHRLVSGSLSEIRSIAGRTEPVRRFEPLNHAVAPG
jgi:rhamnulokinase